MSEIISPRIPFKTVYILGSGFSSMLGIPIISSFVEQGIRLLALNRITKEKDKEVDSEYITKLLDLLNRYRRTLAPLCDADPTIEDILCLADLLNDKFDYKNLTDSRSCLSFFIRKVCEIAEQNHKLKNTNCLVAKAHFFTNYFEMPSVEGFSQHEDNLGVCVYAAFISQLFSNIKNINDLDQWERPTVISLNYDTVIEDHLKLMNLKEETGPKEVFYGKNVQNENLTFNKKKHSCTILKPHGSVNWTLKQPGASKITLAQNPGMKELIPMVLPTWQRGSQENTVFEPLLQSAREHLRLASKWVFIGYSMPPTDTYMRYLFANAMDTPEAPVIEIANMYDSIELAKNSVKKMIGKRASDKVIKNYSNGLKGFVESTTNSSSLYDQL